MRAQIISFHCIMKNHLGQILGSSFNHDVINQLETGADKLEGLVAGLQDLKKGEKRQIFVPANRAYGLYDPELVVEIKRSRLDAGDRLIVGSRIAQIADEEAEAQLFRVIHATEDYVTLDGNHPLAGQDLVFDIEVVSAREALAEDLDEQKAKPPAAKTTHWLH